MAVTTMSKMINPEVMGDMIDAKIEALLKITPYAKVDTTLQGVPGDTKTVPKWAYIGDAVDVAEGAEGQAEMRLAKAIAGKVDGDVFAAALGATKTSGDGTAQIKYTGVVDVVDAFNEEDITDKVLFVNPAQLSTLRKDNDFISADKYNNNVMISGEIGTICQTRIVPSKKVPLIEYTKESGAGSGVVKVVASGATTNEVNLADVENKNVWDAANKVVVKPSVNMYLKAVANPYYMCPCIKLEASSPETEFTETELPAITIFLKKDVQTDAEWKPRTQTHEITTAKYYGVALTNESKVVVAKFKK